MHQGGEHTSLRITDHASVDKAVVIEHAGHVSLTGGELKQRRRPLQTPRDIPEFTGRQDAIRQISDSINIDNDAPAICVLSGMAGVGKTSIATRAANSFSDRFPDGVLYASLAGASAKPIEATEVLTRFLRNLGASIGELPNDYESLVTAYRTLIATKAILVVLDDAADTAQVNDLIPTSAMSAALITSRRPLATLEGAQNILVDVWTPAECIKFLQVLLGVPRITEETKESHELLELCGRLPIALRIIGAQLIRRPSWPLARMVSRLRDEQRRLEVLKADDITIRSVFSTAYESLSPEHSRIFRTVGLSLGLTFSAESIALMADSDNYEVEDLLEDLADRHLITADEVPGRYRIHDLMRLFAREQAHTQESHQEIENNIHRLLEWHLQVLEAGGPSLHSWVRLEKDSLIAGVLAATTRGWNELSWRTANELAAYHSVESDYVDWITCNKAGLISARKCESLEGKSLMLGGLGQASRQLRKFSDAQSYLRESLQGFRDLGDVHRCAQILWEIGKTAASQWDIPQAISAFTESVEIAQSVGHPYDAARAFHALGHLYSGIGRHKESLEFFEKELEVTTRNDANPRYQGFTYQGMAACLASSSMSEQSLDAYDKSIAAAREGGDRESLRIRLTRKAKVLESMGRLTEAYSVHREAIETARVDRDASGLIWARHNLADTFVREGKMGDADSIFSQIIETGEVEGDPGALIGALHCWGDSYARRGETRRAIELLDKAIQASRDNEQEQNLIEISLCRSRVEENQGAYSTGLPYTLEAVSVARSYGSARILAKCLKRLGALLEKLEEEKDATESFEEQIRLEVLMQQWSEALISANKLSSLWEKLGDPSKAEKYAASASEYSAKSIARGSIFPEQIEK